MKPKTSSNIEKFRRCLRAVERSTEVEGALQEFLARTSVQVVFPWKSPKELTIHFQRLAKLFESFEIDESEILSRGDEIFYSCSVKGRSRYTGVPLDWRYAGRLLFDEEGFIKACVLYADWMSLYRKVEAPADMKGALPAEFCRAEVEELREPQRILELCEASGWAAVVYEEESQSIVSVNSLLASLLGKRGDELKGESLFSLFEGKERSGELCLVRGLDRIWLRPILERPIQIGQQKLTCRAFSTSPRLDPAFRFQEEERAALSREIHDGVAQDAAALRMFLLSESSFDSPTSKALVKRMADEAHALMSRLRNPVEEGLLLPLALNELVKRHRVESYLEVDLQMGPLPTVSNSVALVLFRIIQEALRNIAEHSGCKQARVNLETAEDGGIEGSVVDQGVGFSTEKTESPGRYGIRGMSERCQVMGGRFRLTSELGEGTSVTFWLPASDLGRVE